MCNSMNQSSHWEHKNIPDFVFPNGAPPVLYLVNQPAPEVELQLIPIAKYHAGDA